MDLQEHKNAHPELEKRLSNMERQAVEAEQLIDLKGHPGVVRLVDELQQRIEGINLTLTTKRISEAERDMLFVQRDCWNMLLGRFAHAEITIVNIEKYLSKL